MCTPLLSSRFGPCIPGLGLSVISEGTLMPSEFLSYSRSALVFGPKAFADLGHYAKARGFRRPLLVADRGIVKSGYAERARHSLESEGIGAALFSDFGENPDTDQIERGRAAGIAHSVDSLVALGGGSSLDCAKGINFLLTNGGHIRDYWGYDKAKNPLLPSIGVPTTTGTGSEAQTYALISDSETKVKMAVGAPSAAFGLVILDPEVACTQPRVVLATAGYDAISHAVETAATTRRNLASAALSRESWRLLVANFERLLRNPDDIDAAGNLQYGAYLAGSAIEHSMLGGAHATANPLTAAYGLTHGLAIGLMLGPAIMINGTRPYCSLEGFSLTRIGDLARAAGFPRRLRDLSISPDDIDNLANAAAQQWTGRFNPRPFDAILAREMYQCAY